MPPLRTGNRGAGLLCRETLGIATRDVITLKKDDYIKELKVTTIIRDAQMNVAMTSSKRFLISPADQEEPVCTWENGRLALNFLLKDGLDTGALEQAYAAADLPASKVAITASLLNLLNVFPMAWWR